MSQATLLRTLTKKSILKFGKHADMMVGNVMKIGNSEMYYLVWVYYNCSMISFNEEILNELRISKDLRIEKPGQNPKNIYVWKDTNLSEDERMKLAQKGKSVKKFNRARSNYFDGRNHSSYSLTRKNHGHEK